MTAVASFALVVLAACGGGEEHEDVTRVPTMSDAAAQATSDAASAPATPVAGSGTPATGEATPTSGGETAAAAMTVDVVSYDIYFEPDELTIPANTDVTVVLPNEGVTPHNFSIDALDISVDIAAGATEEVVINAPAGEYEFYCNVPGHKQAGMVGTLIVSEDAAASAPAGAATPAGTPAVAPEATPVAAEATTSPAESTPAEPVAAASPVAAATDAQTVEFVAYDIYYEPKEVTIPANTDVTALIANDGVTLHNFSIDELGIDIDIAPGETQETVINAPAGEYQYYCNVPGHKDAGMFGTLIVTDDTDAATPAAAAEQDAAAPVGATPAASTTEATSAAASDAPAASEPVEVVSFDIYFEPEELAIPADTDVPVSLPNEGVTLHNFSIDELDIDVDIAPGATEEVIINAPAGTYEFYCNIPGHKAAGMLGTLTVG